MVVAAGLTACVPLLPTLPIPWSMLTEAAPLTAQLSVELLPDEMLVGDAVKLLMTGIEGVEETVIVAMSDFVESAWLVATTVYWPVVAGAVNRPLLLIVPACAVQITAVSLLPETLALNCCVPPGVTFALWGVTAMLMPGGPAGLFALLPPPHAASPRAKTAIVKINTVFVMILPVQNLQTRSLSLSTRFICPQRTGCRVGR